MSENSDPDAKEKAQANTMWGGRFAAGPAAVMEAINASIDFDKRMAAEDIEGSRVHVDVAVVTVRLAAADVEYEVSLPFGTTHTLRLQGSQPDHVFLVHVSDRFLSIARQRTKDDPPGSIILAMQRQR